MRWEFSSLPVLIVTTSTIKTRLSNSHVSLHVKPEQFHISIDLGRAAVTFSSDNVLVEKKEVNEYLEHICTENTLVLAQDCPCSLGDL